MKNPIHHGTDAESEGNAIYFPVVCTFFHQLILWPSYNPASHPSSGSPSSFAVSALALPWLPPRCLLWAGGPGLFFLFLLFTFISRPCADFASPRLVGRVSLLGFQK